MGRALRRRARPPGRARPRAAREHARLRRLGRRSSSRRGRRGRDRRPAADRAPRRRGRLALVRPRPRDRAAAGAGRRRPRPAARRARPLRGLARVRPRARTVVHLHAGGASCGAAARAGTRTALPHHPLERLGELSAARATSRPVRRAIDYIRAGRRLPGEPLAAPGAPIGGRPVRALRAPARSEPGPFMALARLGGADVVSASPERFLRAAASASRPGRSRARARAAGRPRRTAARPASCARARRTAPRT